ncbi:periplasmic component [Pseudomonas syringae pv. actinidiae]|uniref:Periplasmic component n=1 Tax=Pseudomonas syringae pv. actinidiae TaxID=103796 RepID=A0A2V0QSB9_PSESF|nr:periplasmic component [Pseudomonas syringae pv. actinidiae]
MSGAARLACHRSDAQRSDAGLMRCNRRPADLEVDRCRQPRRSRGPHEQVIVAQVFPGVAPVAFVEQVIHGQAQHGVIPAHLGAVAAADVEQRVVVDLHRACAVGIFAGAVLHTAKQGQTTNRQAVIGLQRSAVFGHVERLMVFIGLGAAAFHPRTNSSRAGRYLQAVGQPAARAQFKPGVLLLALLNVSKGAVIVGPGILVGLAGLKQRRGQAHALPVVLDARLKLPRYGRCESFAGVGGEPSGCPAQREALAVAGVQRKVVQRLVDQSRLRKKHITFGVPRIATVLVERLFIKPDLTPAQHGLPMFVEADTVGEKQPVLAAVQAAFGVRQRQAGRLDRLRRFIDVARAHKLVEGAARVYGAPVGAGAEGQLMFESTGRECARHRSLDLIVATRVVGAAEVIDVVPPLGAEMVGHSFCRTTGRTIAAPRKGAVVIDDHPAAGCTEAALPAVIEPVFEAPAHVQRFDTHWIGPVLIAQQFARRGIVGQRCAAQQLITGHRALLFVLILDVQLQQGPLADVPVERQRCKVALTVGMLDIGANVFVRQVGAQTELLLAAKPAADVGGDVAFTVLVGGHRDRPDVLRAFGLIVDDAARLGNAALQARQALEQLDLLLVLQRHVLLAGDAAAIDAIAVGRVQREAAHHKVFVIAYRRITVAHRGIVSAS